MPCQTVSKIGHNRLVGQISYLSEPMLSGLVWIEDGDESFVC